VVSAALLLLACSDKGVDSAEPAEVAATSADAGPDLEVEVGAVATFDASASVGLAFVWDFGDGGGGEGEVAEHTYDTPGNYVAVLQVTGEDGVTRSDSLTVNAYLPAADSPPDWSRTLLLDAERGRLWVVNPEADTVAVIDAESGERLAELATCDSPRTVALDGDTVAAACEDGDALALFDAEALSAAGEVALPVGGRPFGVVGRGGVWWVALQSTGEVAEVEGGALTLHPVGPDPRGVAIGADGAVYATRFRSNTPTFEPAEDAYGEVYVVGGETLRLAWHPGPDSDTTNRGVPNLAQQVLISPDGGRLFVPSLQHNNARGLWRDGEPLTFEEVVRAALSMVDLATGESDPIDDRKLFDDQDRAIAAAFTPRGSYLYVAHPGTGVIQRIDAWNFDTAGSILDAGAFVTDLTVSPDGDTLYVHAWLDREVRAYDISEISLGAGERWRAGTLAEEPLEAEVLAGKRIFYSSADTRMAKDGYLHCGSCHPDGRDDGMTWDFTDRGEGLRNTTSLEGRAGMGMGPVHWSGNFDEIQDFENDIRGGFGGTGFLSDEDFEATEDTLGAAKAGRSAELDALAAFVSSLEATPTSPFADDGGGEALFEQLDCAECHPPPLYTDSSLDTFLRHDVGTLTEASGGRLGGALDGLDTPTLLGAQATGPWLHDGSAGSIEAAIAAHEGVSLSEAELGALADFVRGL
jgi:DNA-binding beta-propeller fold protein YncE